jgi:hypothetical protein
MEVSYALLDAPAGIVGSSQDKLEVTVPAGAYIDVRTKDRTAGAFIDASTGARLRVDGREFIIGPAGVTTPESLATNNTLLVDVSAIDWASLDPRITLFDCLEPCARLPADQDEGEAVAKAPAQAPAATKLLLIRTSFGWKWIPVVPAAETAALRE